MCVSAFLAYGVAPFLRRFIWTFFQLQHHQQENELREVQDNPRSTQCWRLWWRGNLDRLALRRQNERWREIFSWQHVYSLQWDKTCQSSLLECNFNCRRRLYFNYPTYLYSFRHHKYEESNNYWLLDYHTLDYQPGHNKSFNLDICQSNSLSEIPYIMTAT